MKIIKESNNININKIIENHKHWLREDVDGWRNMRADISDMDLTAVCLNNASLQYAKFNRCILHNASLINADLRNVIIHTCDLSNADLKNSDLRFSNLYKSDLSETNLYNADLHGSDLSYVNLEGSLLDEVNLVKCNLKKCNLTNCSLRFANLYGANLDSVGIPMIYDNITTNLDSDQLKQMAYYLVSIGLNSNNTTIEDCCELSKLIPYVNTYKRVIDGRYVRIPTNADIDFFHTIDRTLIERLYEADIDCDVIKYDRIANDIESIINSCKSNFGYGIYGQCKNSQISKIQYNPKKQTVFVMLDDGRKTVVRKTKGTKHDIYSAVAYALAKLNYGTNTQFKKDVDNKLEII